MGDASSIHPVLATGDAGQSNFVGGATNSSSSAGGFIALDVGALSSLTGEVGPPEAAVVASPRPPRTPKVMRSLSRKGERKPADGDGNGNAGGGGGERPQLFVHVATGDLGDASGARLVVHTPVAGTPSGKSRRLGRRPAPWLDPRRVVFLFATLSSVGTLILLYFTLSMSRTDSSDGGAAAASDAR
ncbi:hypothetical protein PR202_gb21054 [Eleusine coracana subsp. coracana]|uniref:Uncharacterized protein n=1 Tax=Eleusine coracana subsp. coracana TaxID=191504 RepID=A0AAV5FCA0_ELECO|nr:hypothetical protein QOZ80_7BG0601870 [Eleusine coracana subsp. coracana]GJN32540.1 hypothetical protein PR202_gb21054 [Eleusine coracana subsp. coracana]